MDIPSGFPSYAILANISSVDDIDVSSSSTLTNGTIYDFELEVTFSDPGSSATYTDWITGNSSCVPINTCLNNGTLELCTSELTPIDYTEKVSPCLAALIKDIESSALQLFEQYLTYQKEKFETAFIGSCSTALASESYSTETFFDEYHFTLYYYDLAGNLAKTVPPNGVTPFAMTQNQSDQVNTARENGTTLVPSHTMESRYRYNSRNQVTRSITPDGGETIFWYDKTGLLIYSQDEKQRNAAVPEYTYREYNAERKLNNVSMVATTDVPVNGANLLNNQLNYASSPNYPNNPRKERVRMSYHGSYFPMTNATVQGLILGKFSTGKQENVRNRLSSVVYYKNYNDQGDDYQSAYHYSYDELGNVKEVVSHNNINPSLIYFFGLQHTEYVFDYVTGNVIEMIFQKGEVDEFHHRYNYDEANRLQSVETSRNGIIWDQDAKYFYYEHGPLARVEVGEEKVHGQDFYYTLHGWIRGVNSDALNAKRDPGKDGEEGYYTAFPAIHRTIAKDAYAYSLGYYDGDYSDAGNLSTINRPMMETSGSAMDAGSFELFNGNIRHAAYNMIGLSTGSSSGLLGQAYQYDALNRLKRMEAIDNFNTLSNDWGTSTTTDYLSEYSYDPNGNIEDLKRNGEGLNVSMDDMAYSYISGTNKLDFVNDGVSSFSGYDDIKQGQTAGNYDYDEIGQLISDDQENMTIEWNRRNKVHKITVGTGTDPEVISFEYDPNGNRILKRVKHANSPDATLTYYARDAQGQILATYEYDSETGLFIVESHPIYGSSRVGVNNTNASIVSGQNLPEQIRGKKQYELSNHLGNVLTTLRDRKLTDQLSIDMDDDFDNGTSLDGWAATSGSVTLVTDDPNDRLHISTAVSNEGAYKAVSNVAGEIYTLRAYLDPGNSNGMRIIIYEAGSTNILLDETILKPNNYVFSYEAASASSEIHLLNLDNNASPFDLYVNSVYMEKNPVFGRCKQCFGLLPLWNGHGGEK